MKWHWSQIVSIHIDFLKGSQTFGSLREPNLQFCFHFCWFFVLSGFHRNRNIIASGRKRLSPTKTSLFRFVQPLNQVKHLSLLLFSSASLICWYVLCRATGRAQLPYLPRNPLFLEFRLASHNRTQTGEVYSITKASTVKPWLVSIICSGNMLVIQSSCISKLIFP